MFKFKREKKGKKKRGFIYFLLFLISRSVRNI